MVGDWLWLHRSGVSPCSPRPAYKVQTAQAQDAEVRGTRDLEQGSVGGRPGNRRKLLGAPDIYSFPGLHLHYWAYSPLGQSWRTSTALSYQGLTTGLVSSQKRHLGACHPSGQPGCVVRDSHKLKAVMSERSLASGLPPA